MKKNSLVSIVIPAYNEEKNIARLLSSVRGQSYSQIEIIVIDDASVDGTFKIASKFTKAVYRRKHAERSVQRNFGAEKSIGGYLLFLDADMELSTKVVEDCLAVADKTQAKAITIPEKTVGKGCVAQIRNFEREMYMGDATIEVPRFFEREAFFEFGGYDKDLTGPEDYDLPYRIGKKYKIGRSHEYLLHHEDDLTLGKLLKKKYYYAKAGALYAQKHPELMLTQGNILLRKAYFRSWKKFLKDPLLGISFIFVRILETIFALTGYVSAVGLLGLLQSFYKMIRLQITRKDD